jgi:hypothetical protein
MTARYVIGSPTERRTESDNVETFIIEFDWELSLHKKYLGMIIHVITTMSDTQGELPLRSSNH